MCAILSLTVPIWGTVRGSFITDRPDSGYGRDPRSGRSILIFRTVDRPVLGYGPVRVFLLFLSTLSRRRPAHEVHGCLNGIAVNLVREMPFAGDPRPVTLAALAATSAD